jgi:hypothetical protein
MMIQWQIEAMGYVDVATTNARFTELRQAAERSRKAPAKRRFWQRSRKPVPPPSDAADRLLIGRLHGEG